MRLQAILGTREGEDVIRLKRRKRNGHREIVAVLSPEQSLELVDRIHDLNDEILTRKQQEALPNV